MINGEKDRVREILALNMERAGDELTNMFQRENSNAARDEGEKAIAMLAILCNLADQITKRDLLAIEQDKQELEHTRYDHMLQTTEWMRGPAEQRPALDKRS